MAKTMSLNDTNSIMVTSYFGGMDRGRCYTISIKIAYMQKIVADLTEAEFIEMIVNYADTEVKRENMPDPDNRRVPTLDPQLEAILDEEEALYASKAKQDVENRFLSGTLIGKDHVGRYAQVGDMTGIIGRAASEGLYTLAFSNGGWTIIRDGDIVELL